MPIRQKIEIPVFTSPALLWGPIDLHVISATLIFGMSFLVAVQNFYAMLFSFGIMAIALGIVNGYAYRRRIRSKFFITWALLSYLQLLLLFQLVVVPRLKVLFSENVILTSMVVLALILAQRTRMDPGILHPHKNEDEVKILIDESGAPEGRCAVCLLPMPPRTSHCLMCGFCVLRRDHHCIWLDTCIGAKNHRYFILGLLSLAAGLFYGANLTLTSICQPMMFWGLFLVPQTCPDIFDDWLDSWVYASAVYAMLAACLVSLLLLQQLTMVACNTTVYEIKKYQQLNGSLRPASLWTNCFNFWVK